MTPPDRAGDEDLPLRHNGIDPARTSGFVLVLPGGGYVDHAPHEAGQIAEWLASAGIPAAVLHYAVAPAEYPRPLTQVLRALAAVRGGRFGAVAGPVVVLGFSAGGHLAGLAGTATAAELGVAARPDGMVLCYPVVSMVHRPHLGSRASLLAGRDPASAAEAAALSVENRVDPTTPPTFLCHTATDAAVPPEHSLRLAAALVTAEVPVELHLFPEGRHGLGLTAAGDPPGARRWPDLCLGWLRDLGVGAPRGGSSTLS